MRNVKALKIRQLQAVRLLALGTPAYQVAETLQVSYMTIYRWQRLPAFSEKLNVITSSGLEETARQLNAAALTAVETIHEILSDMSQPPTIRLKAALGALAVMSSVNNAVEKGIQHRVADFDVARRFGGQGQTYDNGGEPSNATGESITL